jgi:hypothetical protein
MLMRFPDDRLMRNALRAALAGALALNIAACEQANTAEERAPRAGGADGAGPSAGTPGVLIAAARKPVDDKTLAVNVKAALTGSAALNAITIEVSVKDGVVTLSGTTNTSTRRDLAGYLALRVDGVAGVRNRIAVVSGS